MQIHRVRGTGLADALGRAKRLVGSKGLVLQTETDDDGQVTVSVGVEPPGPVERLAHYGFGEEGGRRTGRTLAPGLSDVRRRMRRHGASARWIEEVWTQVGAEGGTGHPIDRAARAIGRGFEPARAGVAAGGTRVIALVGPTGVGKTTTLAKLAERMTRRGRRVALASLDDFRAGAVDQARAFAEALEVPFHAPRDIGALEPILRGVPGLDVLLLDTTGRSPKDGAELSKLAHNLERVGRAGALLPYLVQSATSSRSALEAAHRAYAPLGAKGLVLTKFDETEEPASVLEHARATRLPLAFLCDGQDVRGHLHRPTPDALANLVLKGSIE